MADNDIDDPEEIGRRIGLRLLASRSAAANPAIAIKRLIAGLVEQFPGVKLPHLAADVELQTWMAGREISKGQLRSALTDARRAQRQGKTAGAVKRLPKARAKRRAAAAPTVVGVPTLPGIVPNRSLDEL